VLPPVQWASRNISIEEGDPASCLPSLIALTKSIQQVSGRVVVDPLSYFNRSDFETSDIESDDSSSLTTRRLRRLGTETMAVIESPILRAANVSPAPATPTTCVVANL